MYLHKCNINNYLNQTRSKSVVKYIVIHYTANDGDTARNNVDYFARNVVGASAHYFVDEKEVCCSVPWYNIAWHCGEKKYAGAAAPLYSKCKNYNSIGVEMCSRRDSSGSYYFAGETVERCAEFVAQLMVEYGVPISNVVRHYDVTGKRCPAPFVNEKAWESFKKLVERKLEKPVEYLEKLEDIPAGELRDTIELIAAIMDGMREDL